jgi:acylphosphatase
VAKSSGQPDQQRRIVLFEGRVQGVGFRYTTRQIAAEFAVTGFVENLPDGRVRLVCEGPPNEVERFIAAVRKQMEHYVRSLQASTEAARGEFDTFFIRR